MKAKQDVMMMMTKKQVRRLLQGRQGEFQGSLWQIRRGGVARARVCSCRTKTHWQALKLASQIRRNFGLYNRRKWL
jgi:hypothetical protein